MRHAYQMDHGAAILPDGMVRFRIWSPSERTMRISLDGGEPQDMIRDIGDWFRIELPGGAGTRYSFVLPDGMRVPDPTSRLQDGDVHDASVVVDPLAFEWRHDWIGRPWQDTVLYEIHPGTVGGFRRITEILPELAETGITAIELMPIEDFPGRHNWGYDGVLPYAPDTAYGTPDDLKRLIDTAHGLGMMVFLDVVYNHFGPDGAYIHIYAKSFFSDDFHTPWGAGIDFRRSVVQEFFIHNALYWLREYRFDGLRFDALGAVQPQEFLVTLASRIRTGVEPGRLVHLVMEHEYNAARLLRGSFDAQWTDDVHHALHVLLTGETFGYFGDFEDATGLLVKSLIAGFAYQGEVSKHSGQPRGENSTDLPTCCFVVFDQNHDQIGNRAVGDRLTASVDARAVRAARAFLLLSPFIPLLFMGDDWATRTPFQFFTDHRNDDLAEMVRVGRRSEFGAFFGDEAENIVPDPNHIDTFQASCLDFSEALQPGFREERALTKHLLALRRDHIAPRITDAHSTGAAVLAPAAVLGGWSLDDGAILRIAMNLGTEPACLERADLPLLYAADLPLLYASDDVVAASVREGNLPGYSTAVWLSGLERDAAPHGIVFA
jgi:maltooligosyltrehalose trehalohydrolase